MTEKTWVGVSMDASVDVLVGRSADLRTGLRMGLCLDMSEY